MPPLSTVRRLSLLILAFTPVLAPAAPLHAQVAAVTPVDEAALGASFDRFRTGLLEAVERRDTAAVLDALADDVLAGFGADPGIDGFRRQWFDDGNERAADRSLWAVLDGVLRGGGVFRDDTTFVAPWTFARFPDGLDGFLYGVVTGRHVRARAEPGLDGRVLTTLTHVAVAVPDWQEEHEADGLRWLAVELDGGRMAWMASRYVRSPLDWRGVFRYRDGRWVLRSLVAGD